MPPPSRIDALSDVDDSDEVDDCVAIDCDLDGLACPLHQRLGQVLVVRKCSRDLHLTQHAV